MINRSSNQLSLNHGIFWKAALKLEGSVISSLGSSADCPEWLNQLREREEKEETKML